MKRTGQAIRDAAEKGGYGYRWWKANDIEHNEGYNTANAFAHGAPERSQFLEGTTEGTLLAGFRRVALSLAPTCGSHRFRQRR